MDRHNMEADDITGSAAGQARGAARSGEPDGARGGAREAVAKLALGWTALFSLEAAALYLPSPGRSDGPLEPLPAGASPATANRAWRDLAEEAYRACQPQNLCEGAFFLHARPLCRRERCHGVLIVGSSKGEIPPETERALASLVALIGEALARDCPTDGLLYPDRSPLPESTEGVIVYDRAGNILGRSAGVARMLGRESSEILAALVRQPHPGPGDADLSLCSYNEAGHSIRASLIPLAESPSLGAVAVLRDRAVAEEISCQKEAFLAQATHELRNPLSIIKMYVDFLGAELSASANDRSRRALATVRRNVDLLLKLSQDLLDHTRLELGEFTYDYNRVETEAVLAAVIPESRLLCAGKDLELKTEIHRHGIGYWDRLRIEQILLNLLTNAVKYSPPRGAVHLKASVESGSWHVVVADAGIGLSPEELKHIFKPYYRVGGEATGTGLGLAISQKLALAHGGSIWAESEGRGKGCAFHLLLPLAAAAAPAMAAQPTA